MKPYLFFFLTVIIYPVKAQDDLVISNKIQEITEDNILKSEDYFNWGGSIIKGDDNKYHLFYSRWPKSTEFTGWLLFSEIAHAISDTPYGPWKYIETALKSGGKGRWDAITAHNPKIKKFEGKYYLYYISTNLGGRQDYTEEELLQTAKTGYKYSNWTILRPNQRTGVAVSNSLNGPWQRKDAPLIEPSGPITTLTVNPAITQGKDGRYYLIIKGDKPNDTNFTRNQALAISEKPDAEFKIQEKPVIDYLDTEDMSLWYDEKRDYYYGVFHAHTFIGMVSSPDGINWEKAQDYEIMQKRIGMEDGTEILPDRMERPFVFVEDGIVKALCLAVKKGNESYFISIPIK